MNLFKIRGSFVSTLEREDISSGSEPNFINTNLDVNQTEWSGFTIISQQMFLQIDKKFDNNLIHDKILDLISQ